MPMLNHPTWETALLAASPLWRVWDSIWPYLLMMLGFSVIVFVHELGHFLVAKWAGVRVDRFAVGFGRELFGFTHGETRYSFNILPLGGYVKMLGQEDFDDKAEELKFSDDPRSFVNKPVGHRMAIVSAGVVMNVLLACLLFMAVFLIGKEDLAPRIALVEPDSPAEEAGILPGDVVKEMNGRRVLTFDDVLMNVMLAPPHEPIEFVLSRNGEIIPPVHVVPEQRRPEGSRGGSRLMVGIGPGNTSEIAAVAPHIDPKDPKAPRPGDQIVEVDGIPVSDDNVDLLLPTLAYASGDVVVERRDPKNEKAEPQRVHIDLPPQLAIYPADPMDKSTASVLGFSPLMRFARVMGGSRADVAGIEPDDTIMAWNDQPYPDLAFIDAAVRDNAEFDIPFTVRKPGGTYLTGFVRPKRDSKGRGTIAAEIRPMDPDVVTDDGPQAIVHQVQPRGPALDAGLRAGDRILEVNGQRRPTSAAVNRIIRERNLAPLLLTVRGADGKVRQLKVRPQHPGKIGASYELIAEDVLIVGPPVPDPDHSPAFEAASQVPPGSEIIEVAGESVGTWTELINAFRASSGKLVPLRYRDKTGVDREIEFPVPRSIHSMMDLGPQARIVSIDGKRSVEVETKRGRGDVAVHYHLGTKQMLKNLVGSEDVPVEYRVNPLAPLQTAYIDVTADMVDPWLARVSFRPNIVLEPELTLVKGESAFDAVRIGFHETFNTVLQVYETIKRMVVSRSVGVENISGPLGIVSIGGRIARMGMVDFMFFMALISANLAVINFLPLPIVDGGLMVFLIIEKIKGSPVSLRVQVATQMIGLMLIVFCFVFVTYNDALKLWG